MSGIDPETSDGQVGPLSFETAEQGWRPFGEAAPGPPLLRYERLEECGANIADPCRGLDTGFVVLG